MWNFGRLFIKHYRHKINCFIEKCISLHNCKLKYVIENWVKIQLLNCFYNFLLFKENVYFLPQASTITTLPIHLFYTSLHFLYYLQFICKSHFSHQPLHPIITHRKFRTQNRVYRWRQTDETLIPQNPRGIKSGTRLNYYDSFRAKQTLTGT